MNKIFFISFASTDIKYALKRIGKQAASFNLFDEIYLYTEKKLPKYAKKRCADIIRKTGTRRGYAYWCWKPVIINQVFSEMSEGDIFVYSDAGTHMNPNGRTKLLDVYIPLAQTNDIWVVRLEEFNNDVAWTKADTLAYFRSKITDESKLADFERQIHEGMLEGGTIIGVKNDYTMEIMRQWEQLMSFENIHLFDDSPSRIPELPEFHENRHDQSMLSLLLKTNHYAATTTDHFWSKDSYTDVGGGWRILRETEPFLHLRDIHRKKKDSLPVLLWKKVRPILGKIKRRFFK